MGKGFLILISFFTRIPLGNMVKYDEESLRKSIGLYSIVGLIIGCILVPVYFLGAYSNIRFIKGIILLGTYIIVTGAIHFDGAADTVDGLFSGRKGNRIFEIMSDSHIGAFGVICIVFLLLFDFILLSYSSLWTCLLFPVVGRASIVIGCSFCEYAKKEKGMGTLFIENMGLKETILTILILIILCFILPVTKIMLLSVGISIIIACIITLGIRNKIGGMTGDTCGFLLEITQAVFMITTLYIERII